MANFSATSFISTYTSTSRTIRILDISGNIVFTLLVCNYQKSLVSGVNLLIVLEDSQEYVLDFSTTDEAQTALTLFKTAIDSLIINCPDYSSNTGGGGSDSSLTPVSITYSTYKSSIQADELIPLQWYDIHDVSGTVLPAGSIVRAFCLSSSDAMPKGTILDATNAGITFDFINDTILSFELPANNSVFINCTTNQNISSNSSNIFGKNNSVITATNTSVVNANNSTATLTNCNNINLNNSVVTLVSGQNLILNNIQQDLSSIGFNLTNVSIDRNDSPGKEGRTEISGSGSNLSMQAYNDLIEENITFSTNNNTQNIIIDNKIIQANAYFKFRYQGTGAGNNINILDKSSNNLFTISDAEKNSWATFKFNIATGLFEFENLLQGLDSNGAVGTGGTPYTVSSVTNGQTSFVLPIPSTKPNALRMFVNGQKKLFGLDFTYTSSGQTVTYLNRDFSLSSVDEVDFVIF